MAVDNRTLMNSATNNTGWSGDDTANANSDAGSNYEGGDSLSTQLSNSIEHMYTTSIGGTRDMSNASVWMLVKDNLQSSRSNSGGQIVLHDGTDRVGFYINGNDEPGLSLPSYFNCLKLDVSNISTLSSNVYAGVLGNLTVSAITGVGYGTNHAAKAVGSIDNVWMDAMYFIVNTSYAMTINAGTVGTPDTWAIVVADDIATGFGVINNLVGSRFDINASWEWGDTANADSYFEDSNFQVYIDARDMAAGNFIVRTIAGSGTNSLVLADGLFINTGSASVWDLSDTGMNNVELTRITWQDCGTFLFSVQSAGNRFLDTCTFNNCGQVSPDTIDMDDVTFNGSSDATGAMLLDETQSGTANLTNMTFSSDGTGYGIRIAPTGAGPFTYNFDNFQNTGYGADDTADAFIRIAPATNTANITINLQNGAGTITVDDTSPYTGTVTINNAQTVTVNGVTEGAAVKVIADETVGSITTGDIIFELLADSTGTAQITTFNYEAAFDPSGLDVIIRTRQQGLPNYAISEDNAVFSDQTTSANSSSVDDMTLIIASPVAGQDYYYFGHAEEFSQLKLDISTAGTGGFVIAWEYWNGAWVALSGVSDGTSSFSNTGENIVSWTSPGDWATTSVDGNGPVFYVRAAYVSGTVTIAPLGRKAKLDVTRYLPFVQNNTITSTGLTVTASWAEDTIASF